MASNLKIIEEAWKSIPDKDISDDLIAINCQVPVSEISMIISELVETTSKNNGTENQMHDSEVTPRTVKMSQNDAVKAKLKESECSSEKDIPIRRSTRIRRTVVKKDAYVPPRSTAKKNKKNSDILPVEEKIAQAETLPSSTQKILNSTSPSIEVSPVPKIEVPLPNECIPIEANEVDIQAQKSNKTKKTEQNSKNNVKIEKKSKEIVLRKELKTEKKDSKVDKKESKPKAKEPLADKRKCSKRKKLDKVSESTLLKTDDEDPPSVLKHEITNPSPVIVVVCGREAKSSCTTETNVPPIQPAATMGTEDANSDLSDRSVESSNLKPVKVKSRWWRSSELEGVLNSESLNPNLESSAPKPLPMTETSQNAPPEKELGGKILQNLTDVTSEDNSEKILNQAFVDPPVVKLEKTEDCKENEKPVYDHIEGNIYKFSRKKSKSKKEVRRMICDCTLTKEEVECGVLGCKEECLNRLLMIECGSRCPLREACSNKKFQKKQYIKAEIIKTEKKGFGLKTLENISAGDFLMEFVGEVVNHKEYRQRAKQYAKEKNVHCYFMALKTDEILDATHKGNYTRFINHSCDPNCETQKWTVNGELRVGVFAKKSMSAGEELTLDYKFQRYGREAQKCYCGTPICSGYIGGAKQISIDAYSSNKSGTNRKRKDDKKRDFEDKTLEEEIEKLNGNKGLRNKEETLRLARLMVRADDSGSQNHLLDIIIKTEEQACLRLFLDYHGLPLLWCWMADVVDFDLKAKILQVLSLLPISNKTMLLDSKVMSIVEKWLEECAENKLELLSNVASNIDVTYAPVVKKAKTIDLSDSETDSSGSHSVVDNPLDSARQREIVTVENEPAPMQIQTAEESNSSENIPSETIQGLHSDKSGVCAESYLKSEDGSCVKLNDPEADIKSGITNLAQGLLNNWKNLKEVFRIPRLEQQKRKEDELEADLSVLAKTEVENKVPEAEQTGDHIQVLINRGFVDNHRYDYGIVGSAELDDIPLPMKKKTSLPKQPLKKQTRRHMFAQKMDEEASLRKINEDKMESPSECEAPAVQNAMSIPFLHLYQQMMMTRPPQLPAPAFGEQPPHSFPPQVNPPANPMPGMDPTAQIAYPPQMINTQTQPPFMGTAPPVLPPPASIISQPPPVLQHPPPTVGMPPPIQSVGGAPPNMAIPPNPNSLMLPAQPSVSTCAPPFIPGHTTTMAGYPPGQALFGNQGQPLYYLQQPPGIPNSIPPASFPENPPVQVAVQPTPVPVVKEEPKPVKLPKNWRSATDSEGNVYYYHSVTRETQWDPPSAEQAQEDTEDEDEDSDSEKSDSSDTPTYDEPKVFTIKHSKRKSKKRKTTKAAADTSVAFPVRPEVAKKIKELFRTKMSSYIVHCLNAYRKSDCAVGRITSNEDFKYLARKLTHYTMTKELKQCRNVEDLDCNETVMHKARDFVKKYMSKYGSHYSRKEKFSPTE